MAQKAIEDHSDRQREAAANFEIIFENNPAPMSITREGVYIEINKAFLNVLGYSRDEVIGRSRSDLNLFADSDALGRMLDHICEHGQVRDFEQRVRRKDGQLRSGLFSSARIEYHGRECLLTVMVDITEIRELDCAAETERKRLQNVIEATRVGTWELMVQTGETIYDEQWAHILGYTLEELQPTTIGTWERLTHPDDQMKTEQTLERHFARETEYYETECRMRHKNGDWVWVLDRGKVVEWDEHGRPLRMFGTHSDITDLVNEREKNEELERFFDLAPDLMGVIDLNAGGFVKLNRAWTTVLGHEADALKRHAWLDLVHPEDRQVAQDAMESMKSVQQCAVILNRYRCADGTYRSIEWNACPYQGLGYVAARDVTETAEMQTRLKSANERLRNMAEELQEKNRQLEAAAYTDQLTGLYNRHFFEQRLEVEMERALRYEVPLSMLLMDLDHFKAVNDTWGHPVGDAVLKRTAEIVRDIVRKPDILARFGGEEFILLMPESDQHAALAAAEKIREALERNSHPRAGAVTASFGVAQWLHAEPFKAWYKRLDDALYSAKESGRNRAALAESHDHKALASLRIRWNKTMESGDKGIDDQHRELIRMSERLIQMVLNSAAFPDILKLFDSLIDHITKHFEYEERVTQAAGYPGSQDHAEIHRQLMERALQLKRGYQNGELKSTALFAFIVDDVIQGHMEIEDVKFFSHIRSTKAQHTTM